MVQKNIRQKEMIDRKRIPQLESMRFFMMILILLSHFEFLEQTVIGNFYKKYLHNPTLGVDYFFMLSGFGLYLSLYNNNSFRHLFDLRGGYRRVKKSYSLYILTMFLAIPVSFKAGLEVHPLNIVLRNTFIKALVSIPLFQSAFGIENISHSFNGVCWFMSTLFLLYCITPKIIEKVRKCHNSQQLVLLLIVGSGITYTILKTIEMHSTFDDFSYSSPYFRIFNYCIGMGIAKVCKEGKWKCSDLQIKMVLFIAIVWFLFRNIIPNQLLLTKAIIRSFDMFLCALIIWGLSTNNGKTADWLGKRKLVWLGKTTSSFFLIHYVVRMYIGIILGNGHINILVGLLSAFLITIISFILSVVWTKYCQYFNLENFFNAKYKG